MTATLAARPLLRLLHGEAASDGAGVRLSRIVGSRACDQVDPFLLLDEFRSDRADDYVAGFPDHPHRGFETVTVMLAGRMRHADSVGNSGVLEAGDVQWMTAGRGIVHSEMPEQRDGLLWGYQLWVNLPARLKMTAPRYQDVRAGAIPLVQTENGTVRVIAGRFAGLEGAARTHTGVTLLDVTLGPGAVLDVPLAETDTALVCVCSGGLVFRDSAERVVDAPAGSAAILDRGDTVRLTATGAGARALLIAAPPLGEPVARMGPFVMNSREELMQAVEDFRSGRLGR